MKFLSVTLMTALLFAGVASAQTSVPAPLQKKFPGLRVQAKVGTKRDAKGSVYEVMTISPSALVEGASTQPQAAMDVTAIIIAMDTKAKYVDRREVYQVQSAETVNLAAATSGAKRNVEFTPTKTTYDAYRDSSNWGGAVYKWYIIGVKDAETKQILHFETNCTPLEKYIKGSPDAREKYLSLRAGMPFDLLFK